MKQQQQMNSKEECIVGVPCGATTTTGRGFSVLQSTNTSSVITSTMIPSCSVLECPRKALNDNKDYRVIRLQNGLTAILISDLGSIPVCEEDEEHDNEDDGEEEEEVEEGDGEGNNEEDIEMEETEGEEEEDECDAEERSEKPNKDTTKYLAAASLTVGVGSFEDPDEIPGLMHFLEHMVFMGSEKYPKENSFDYYMKKHGGHDNAHTDMEHTTFYFEIQEKYLKEGLDRFAQFFIHPLMKQEAMTRERKAVHSEFQMALPDDTSRDQQMFATLASEGHPMGKFTWGNESTLNIGIPDEELHKQLHELRLKYYSAQYMTLAVQARLSLDSLQEFVCCIFDEIPSNQIPRPSYTQLSFPFPRDKFHRLYRIIPTKEYHSVEIVWALPSLKKHYRTKPLHYVGHLLGHEGKGSILSYLKKKVWAVGLYSGNDETGFEHNSTYAMMNICVELTDEGFANLDEVVCVIFQYLAMLREAGPVERIFKEIQCTERLNFDYGEELSTIENVETLSEAMQLYPPQDYLTGDTQMDEYEPQVIRECLDAMLPETCNFVIKSKTFEEQNVCNLSEKWFGTKYCVEDIPESWKMRWANLSSNPELYLPASNPFIPDEFTLLPQEELTGEGKEYPEKLCEDPRGALWYRQDTKFGLPRSYCYIYFLTCLPLQSPRLAALLDLYLNLYELQVMEDVYPANMAQYRYSFFATEQGLVLKINGFNQKLPEVLKLLLSHMENFKDNLTEKSFHEIQRQQMKTYLNAVLKPGTVRKDLRLSVIQEVHWQVHHKLREVQGVSSNDLLDEFVSQLFPSCHIRVLVQGNTSASAAKEMYDVVKVMLDKHAVPDKPPLIPELHTLEMLGGAWVVQAEGVNPADTNSSVINYYQHREGDLATEILLEFIQMVMDEPVFNFLRTKEQLGYHVFCTNHNTYGILGLSVTVNTQANKFSVSHVDKKIEAFLENFRNTMANMKDEELMELKETLTSMKQTIDLTLKEEVERNWSEITHGEYVFNRLKRQIELVKDITREGAVTCLRTITERNNNPTYRKLSVQVVGAANTDNQSPPTLEHLPGKEEIVKLVEPSEENDKTLLSHHYITDIPSYKHKLKVYPVTKIV
ncbi:hypothetical protein Pcinc_024512 [Petrolisthes cinctipes]|uniref:Nardilysin n=1 Tax=Petrolisthes cinctipes TaxID=88211 RepID=A0AAE1KEA9_PETCI|nr:hypothetical protein Pcinc_024512 [Petrolisthes cinctipes]